MTGQTQSRAGDAVELYLHMNR